MKQSNPAECKSSKTEVGCGELAKVLTGRLVKIEGQDAVEALNRNQKGKKKIPIVPKLDLRRVTAQFEAESPKTPGKPTLSPRRRSCLTPRTVDSESTLTNSSRGNSARHARFESPVTNSGRRISQCVPRFECELNELEARNARIARAAQEEAMRALQTGAGFFSCTHGLSPCPSPNQSPRRNSNDGEEDEGKEEAQKKSAAAAWAENASGVLRNISEVLQDAPRALREVLQDASLMLPGRFGIKQTRENQSAKDEGSSSIAKPNQVEIATSLEAQAERLSCVRERENRSKEMLGLRNMSEVLQDAPGALREVLQDASLVLSKRLKIKQTRENQSAKDEGSSSIAKPNQAEIAPDDSTEAQERLPKRVRTASASPQRVLTARQQSPERFMIGTPGSSASGTSLETQAERLSCVRKRENRSKEMLVEAPAAFGRNSKFSPLILARDLAAMYSGEQDVDAIVLMRYKEDAIFEDPLVSVKGQKYIAAQFRGLQWICRRVQYEMLSVTHGTLTAETSGDNRTVVIDAQATFFFWLFPLVIHMHTVCTFSEETGKISRHRDFWDIRSQIENIPVFASVYCFCREVGGSVSSKLIIQVTGITSWIPCARRKVKNFQKKRI